MCDWGHKNRGGSVIDSTKAIGYGADDGSAGLPDSLRERWGDFVFHMVEHEMGGMFDAAHGAGVAAIWPSWARYVYKDCLPRFKRFALYVMGVEAEGSDEEIALAGIEAVESFYHSIGMPINMKELGIEPTEEQILKIAHRFRRREDDTEDPL